MPQPDRPMLDSRRREQSFRFNPALRVASLVAVAATLLLVSGAGCVKRSFVILTDPPGVEVYVDGEFVGTTEKRYRPEPGTPREMQPDVELGVLEVPLKNYAVYEITLRRHGYVTQSYALEPVPPLWEHFPFDLITEVLLPLNLEVQFLYRFTLEHRRDVDFDDVYRIARNYRDQAAGKLSVEEEESERD